MKSLIVLTLVLPFCFAIELDFYQTYGTAIKKVEIPSCSAEPCPFVKGTPLNISITVDSIYPPEKEFPTVTDFETSVSIDGYRNRYIYELANNGMFCKTQPNECPLYMHKLYTIKKQLFLSVDDQSTERTGFGSRNGKTRVDINVIMMAHDNVGTVIGSANIVLDIKAAQN